MEKIAQMECGSHKCAVSSGGTSRCHLLLLKGGQCRMRIGEVVAAAGGHLQNWGSDEEKLEKYSGAYFSANFNKFCVELFPIYRLSIPQKGIIVVVCKRQSCG